MDKKHLKEETTQAVEAMSEAHAQTANGSELSVTNLTPEMLLLQRNSLLMEEILERENLKLAYKTVVENKGCAGIDGMKVEELKDYLKTNWAAVKDQLLTGKYKPKPVKRVEIPKTGGGKRMLGIPTVLDRFIQQATLQILQGYIDVTFSNNSFGFRPKRSAIQAVEKGKKYVEEGCSIVVDIDLEKFFDKVNHDKLMSELFKRISDKRVLRLIRSYLNAGAMADGLFVKTEEGAPQGGPLSPILSNIMLDLLDKELEARGHRYVRYADDCNIYVRSWKAGERVMKTVSDFITQKLKLKVNEAKSKVDRTSRRKFLGFRLLVTRREEKTNQVKIGIAPESIKKFKEQIKILTSRTRGISLSELIKQISRYMTGWIGYYGKIETPTVLQDLDSWIRRKIRCFQLKQWKKGSRRYEALQKLGVPFSRAKQTAGSSKGLWRLSKCHAMQMALSNKYFEELGLKSLAKFRRAVN